MPIRNCPIFSLQSNDTTVSLPIRITNPHTNLTYRTFGIIDTGATECAIPASIAKILGHDIKQGRKKSVSTGNGIAEVYGHTTSIEIFHPLEPNSQVINKLDNVIVDCMPNLNVVLLGVRGFLSSFTLSIDYPNKVFSLINSGLQ